MRIAHNVIMDRYRGIKNDHIVETNEDNDLSVLGGESVEVANVENDYVNQQVMEDVKKMVRMLPAPQREVVYMRFYQDLSFKEIADVTNVSINTALGRMRYALLNMRRMAREHNLQLQLI
jgi:RNA polymerase sigma-70 factor (ECF subfamily)